MALIQEQHLVNEYQFNARGGGGGGGGGMTLVNDQNLEFENDQKATHMGDFFEITPVHIHVCMPAFVVKAKLFFNFSCIDMCECSHAQQFSDARESSTKTHNPVQIIIIATVAIAL